MTGASPEARATEALRGAVAADPSLPRDPARFADAARRAAANAGLDRAGADRLVALRGQMEQAGS